MLIFRYIVVFLLLGCSDDAARTVDDAGYVETRVAQNVCPRIVFMEISPYKVQLNHVAQLKAEVVDPDDGRLAMLWQSTSGRFSRQGETETVFTCVALGRTEITLRVVDSHDCVVSRGVYVDCIEQVSSEK